LAGEADSVFGTESGNFGGGAKSGDLSTGTGCGWTAGSATGGGIGVAIGKAKPKNMVASNRTGRLMFTGSDWRLV
jgi:hypothetical protein